MTRAYQAYCTEEEEGHNDTEVPSPRYENPQHNVGTTDSIASKSVHQPYSTANTNIIKEADDSNMDQDIAVAAANLRITENDSVIALMGLTGTGKSTFINYLTADAEAGHKLKSFTKHVGIHTFTHKDGRPIYLVDTPGFNDTELSDIQVLEKVACFLSATYAERIKLAGIIYLHRITDRRMEHSSLDNLEMFKKLCGTTCLKNVVLATTMWDDLKDQEVGDIRETELKTDPEFWGDLVDLGSTVMRQDRGKESALEIVDYILNLRGPRVVTQIAREMIDDKLRLKETLAGQEGRKQLIAAEKKHAEQLQRLQAAHRAMIEEGNIAAAEKIRIKEEKIQQIQDSHRNDMKILEETFEQTQKRMEEDNKRFIKEMEIKSKIEAEIAQGKIDEKMWEIKNLQTKLDSLTSDIANVKADGIKKADAWQKDMNDQRALMKRQQEQYKMEIEKAREDERARAKAGSPAAVVAAIGGALTTVGGILTFNPALIGAGLALTTGGAVAKVAHS